MLLTVKSDCDDRGCDSAFQLHDSEPYLPFPLTTGSNILSQLRQTEAMGLQAKTSKARREENKNSNLYNQHNTVCTCRTRKTRSS